MIENNTFRVLVEGLECNTGLKVDFLSSANIIPQLMKAVGNTNRSLEVPSDNVVSISDHPDYKKKLESVRRKRHNKRVSEDAENSQDTLKHHIDNSFMVINQVNQYISHLSDRLKSLKSMSAQEYLIDEGRNLLLNLSKKLRSFMGTVLRLSDTLDFSQLGELLDKYHEQLDQLEEIEKFLGKTNF